MVAAASSLAPRLLRVRLSRLEVATSVALPVLVLLPWFGPPILAPVDELHDSGQLLIAQTDPPGPSQWSILGDVTHQLLPWELAVRQALGAGRLPEWDDRFGGGTCLACNPQARVFDPIAWVARATTSLPEHFEATVAIQLMIALSGGLVAAASIGQRGWPRLASAISFGLGGSVTAWALFPNGATAVWLPWLLAAWVRLARQVRQVRQSRVGNRDSGFGIRWGGRRLTVVAALVLAAAWLAGNPQVVVWCAPPLALLALALARKGERLRAVTRLTLAAVLGTALAAPALIPFIVVAKDSARAAELAESPKQWPRSLASSELFEGHGWRFLRSAIDPLAFGRPYRDDFRGPTNWPESASVHAGPLAGLGLLAALVWRSTRRRALLLGAIGLWGWLLGGGFRPLLVPLSNLPMLGSTSFTRALPLVSLALALAVGVGVASLARLSARARLAVAAAAVTVLLAALGPAPRALALATAIVTACALFGRRPRIAAGMLAALLAVDLVLVSRLFLPTGEPHFFYPRNEAITDIERELAAPGGPWRVAGENYAAYPSLLTVHGFEEARPHDPLASARLLEVFGAGFELAPSATSWYTPLRNPEHPLLDFLGVRVLVGDYAQPPKHRLQRIDEPWRHGIHALWRNPNALPRAFVPSKIELVEGARAATWLEQLDDARRVAVDKTPACAGNEGGSIASIGVTPAHLRIELQGDPCLVATSIPFASGWTARAGSGEPLSTQTVNHAFLGVLPAGAQQIELRYRAPGLRLGLVLAALGGLALAGYGWASVTTKGRAYDPEPRPPTIASS